MQRITLEKHYCSLLHKFLIEKSGSFVSVEEMSKHLEISYTDTIDALVILQRKNLAKQSVNGWEAVQ